MKFRAAVLHEVGSPLVVEEVELGDLGPDDVLVRNEASGLCHTDLEVMQGSLRYPLPIVLGHEGAGIVERVGTAVTGIRPGDHVIASWNPNCGHCFYCQRDTPILCEPFTRHQPAGHLLDGHSRLRVRGGELHHFSVVSSHAQYSVLPAAGAIVVPREIPFDRACLIGCGVMTGVGAVLRQARVEAGAIVAVIGCGAVGVNVVQGARLAQAERIVAVDRDPQRLALAARLGATDLIEVGRTDPVDAVKALSAGRGADYVFECAGGEAALRTMFETVRPGGQGVILGKVDVNQSVSLRFGSMMGEKRFIRSSYGGARPARDFPWLARCYLDGRLRLDELIMQRLPLAAINEGFDAMREARALRTVVQPWAQ